ncbi:unnamed protein product [Brachionus calyciflorus]|uniref:Uncharacterized protein n=1 Tax=Brachionus calyciflorus TaxID=104777 RepID=A0A814G9R5_9BILA|nr:unnamed protein product [Brachionus calyciflorus]
MDPNSDFNQKREYKIRFEEMMQREYDLVIKWINYKKERDREARYFKKIQELYNYILAKTTDEFDMFKKNVKNLNSDQKYRLWMHQCVYDLKQLLLNYLKNDTTKSPKFASVKIASLNVDENEEMRHIPQVLIKSLVDAVLKTEMKDKLIKRMKYFMSLNGLRYFTILENIVNLFSVTPGLVKEEKKKSVPKPLHDLDMDLDGIDIKISEEKENLVANSKVIQQDGHRKLFNDCFVNLLKHQLSPNLYKKLLIKLPEKLIPKMTNPLMLSDFLTNSYNLDGLLSVLALNTLFILINSYNL